MADAKQIIEVTQDTTLPGTDIILEKGDKIQLVEAAPPGGYRIVNNDKTGMFDMYNNAKSMGSYGSTAEAKEVIKFKNQPLWVSRDNGQTYTKA